MRILVISNLFPPHGIGGYEERCHQVVRGLRARGHSVRVLTSDYTTDKTDNEPEVIRTLEINGFYGRPWQPIHKLYGLEKRNQQRLLAAIEAFKPDVVHVWNMGGITKSLLLRLERMRIPLVYDISDHWIARSLAGDVWLSWWNDPGTVFRNIGRKLLQISGIRSWIDKSIPTDSYKSLRFEKIYFCSEFMRNITVEKGYPVAHASVIYCGVEAEKFPVKKEYNPPRRFLWVGRFAEDKDPMTAVRAMALLKETALSHCRLDLYGRGEEAYTRQLRETAEAAGITGNIEFCFAPHDELRKRYSEYDALLFTSNWGEPFALTPLEAMASGLPVILSPDGGDRELGRDGENCLLIQPDNPESLRDAMLRLNAIEDHGESLALTARQELMECYDMPVIVDQIEAFLQEAAN